MTLAVAHGAVPFSTHWRSFVGQKDTRYTPRLSARPRTPYRWVHSTDSKEDQSLLRFEEALYQDLVKAIQDKARPTAPTGRDGGY